MAQVTAEQLIREFEGYSSTPYWDVNAWRLGYGSDTMTDAQGNVTRVKKDSTTTREAAQRDLERRIPEFQKQGVIPFVGQKAWDRLPAATKAAITSVAYNYGGLSNLKSLTAAIKAGDSDAMAKALEGYANHNSGINKSRRVKEAAIIRGAPIPPGMLGDDPVRIREQIQDRNAARLGYGEIAPNPGPGRPAYFNETGAPPIPASRTPAAPQPSTMSPALQAARQRLTAAREMKAAAASNGATDQAAMAVTPRLTSANGEVTGIEDTRPQLDWGQFKPGASVGGVGSLLDGGINPAAPNPAKPPVAGLRLPATPTTVTGRPDAPIGSLPAARTGTTVTGRPDAPIGSLPVAQPASTVKPVAPKAPVSSASGPSAGRPGGATSVPVGSSKVDNPASTASSSQPSPVVRKQETGKLSNGKTVTIGQSYIVGDRLMIAEPGKNGTAVLKDVKDTLPFGASMLFENTMGGAAARAIAMPAIKQQLAQAGTAAMDGVNQLASGAVKTVGSLASQARDGVSSLFTLRPAATPSSTSAGNTLSAPGAGLTPAQKAAMISVPLSATVKPLAPAAPKPTNTLIKTTVANPAYAEWEKKYGDGSQIQTAATGGLITANQLAAIQNVNGAVQAPIKKPAIPPPPPKTITVMKPGNNTLAAPSTPAAPPAPKVQTTQTVSGKTVNVGQTYQAGGYLYSFDANGNSTKVGKIGGSPAVKSALATSAPTSAQQYAAANRGSGSVAAMEQQHSGRPAGSYADSREASGTGSLW